MTGYGKVVYPLSDGRNLCVEVKSLNGKGLDLSVRLPRIFSSFEFTLRQKAQTRIDRGKASIHVWWSSQPDQEATELVPSVDKLLSVVKSLIRIADELSIPKELLLPQSAAFLPFLQQENQEEMPDEVELLAVENAVEEAFNAFENYRHTEGQSLEVMFKAAIHEIISMLEQIKPFESERERLIRSRLSTALEKSELPFHVDPDRFEQELIFYLEKQDFSEEKHRLTQNLQYFLDALQEEKTSGKKLGFIAQEIGREINTLGSKCQDARIQKLVVLMKNELEKIKEQILNVL